MNHDPIVRFKELSTQAEQLGRFQLGRRKNYSRPAHAAFIKDVDHRGRVFYPNLQSRKARHQREVYTRQLVVG